MFCTIWVGVQYLQYKFCYVSTGELKQVHIEEKDVRSIMKSLTNIRNDGTVRQGGISTTFE